MAEKPILFSGEMVRAILDGRKTQTRRVIKPQPIAKPNPYDPTITSVIWEKSKNHTIHTVPRGLVPDNPFAREYGDLLWVREAWQAQNTRGQWYHEVPYAERPLHFWAWTNPINPAFDATPPRWLPSIHMPRWASRITLRVTDVRVERVQDISEADAKAEGVSPAPFTKAGRPMEDAYIDSFELLWNEINGPRGFGWDANPWVWVVEFSPLDQIGHSMA